MSDNVSISSQSENNIFKFDEITKEKLNAKMVTILFEILYKKNMITKKEYMILIENTCRTFNMTKQGC